MKNIGMLNYITCSLREKNLGKRLRGCLWVVVCLLAGACEEEIVLTHMPVDSQGLLWIQPFGHVDHGGGNAFFHNGFDFGNPDGAYYSSAAGTIREVDMDTGQGFPGSNYRILIQVGLTAVLDYHFEIGGSVTLEERMLHVFVAPGEEVSAGQHIGNLLAVDTDVAHAHWTVSVMGSNDTCPLAYFTDTVATSLEALYDSGIEKRPANRPDLCE
jgi:hypothetical protein